MFFDKQSGFWVEETYTACAHKIGQLITIGCGRGPWSVTKVQIVKTENIGTDRCKVYAKEVK